MTEAMRRPWRRWGLSALIWVALAEVGGWIADSRLHFRYALLDALRTSEATSEPPRRTPLAWPQGTLRVRVPDQFGPRDEPYIVGGRVIDDAWPDAKQELVTTSDLGDRPRVFVLGGSAAFGYPYAFDSSLAVQLQKARPHLEVVNVGQVGWSSGHVSAVAERILDGWEPSVLVVYSGNNEWIQWTPRPDTRPGEIAIQRLLAQSRALAAALWLGHRRRQGRGRGAESSSPLIGFAHALEHPDRELSVARWLEEKQVFLDVFRENLSTLHRGAAKRGVRVVFLTVPFNYRLSPSWKHRQPDAFDERHAVDVRRALERAGDEVRAGRCDRAMPALDEALALDTGPAILHYLRAVCLERRGALVEAEQAYALSREAMVGNLGARLSVNDVIAEVANADGAELLDVRRLFDDFEHSRGRFFNEELIHDDCHPTPLGHHLIAEALAERLPPIPADDRSGLRGR